MDSGDESVGWVKKPDIPYLGKEDKDYLGITKGDMVKKILQLDDEVIRLRNELSLYKEEALLLNDRQEK